jgi:hypothetical protein
MGRAGPGPGKIFSEFSSLLKAFLAALNAHFKKNPPTCDG